MNKNLRRIVMGAIIASIYTVLTLVFAPISFGVIQFRISEMLTILPFFTFNAVPGLFVGCLLSNIIAGNGIYDIIFGSLATLIAAYMSYKIKNKYLVPLPPVIVNALIIGSMLHYMFFEFSLIFTILIVGFGQLIVCYGLGLPLLLSLEKYNIKYLKRF